MTYRKDSDIAAPYRWIVPIDQPKLGPFQTKFNQPTKLGDLRKNLVDDIKAKNKLVAWVVSHCDTHSEREKYVEELRKHIPVDVYGNCGENFCPGDCKGRIEKSYKFYLSFENSWCKDYVTEKFWDALELTMVPVVLGGANYTSIAPPMSYIDASTYEPKALSKLLKYLDENDEELLKYHDWKSRYQVFKGQHTKFCDICEKLNHLNDIPKKTYHDLKGWWAKSAKCRRKGDFFWSNFSVSKPSTFLIRLANLFSLRFG